MYGQHTPERSRTWQTAVLTRLAGDSDQIARNRRWTDFLQSKPASKRRIQVVDASN